MPSGQSSVGRYNIDAKLAIHRMAMLFYQLSRINKSIFWFMVGFRQLSFLCDFATLRETGLEFMQSSTSTRRICTWARARLKGEDLPQSCPCQLFSLFATFLSKYAS